MSSQYRSFSEILDECLDRVLVMREPLDACLADYPEHAQELRAALESAGALQSAARSYQPSADKKRASRQRFLDALEKRQSARPWWSFGSFAPLLGAWPRLAAMTAVAVIAVVGMGTGTVLASQSSVPGDALYPVKRAAEQTQLALASDDREAELHAQLLDRRVEELSAVAEMQRDEFLPTLVDQIAHHSARAQALASAPVMDFVERLPVAGGTPQAEDPGPEPGPEEPEREEVSIGPVLALTDQLERLETRIEALEGRARNPEAANGLRRALENLGQTKQQLNDLLDSAGPSAPVDEPGSDSPRPAPPANDSPQPQPEATPEVRTERLQGTIRDVRFVVERRDQTTVIVLALEDGETREVFVPGVARRPQYRIGGEVLMEIVSRTGEVRRLQVLDSGPGRGPATDNQPPARSTPTPQPRRTPGPPFEPGDNPGRPGPPDHVSPGPPSR